jgi:pilus assembly protein CpaE
LLNDASGASAVEFALLAPVLILACLATVDIGVAVSQRAVIDDSLRAGVQGALMDLGEDKVRGLVETVASGSMNTSPNPDIRLSGGDFNASAARFCVCPGSVSTTISCSTGTCSGSAKPFVYYRIAAQKTHDTILLPSVPLRGSILVQVQ